MENIKKQVTCSEENKDQHERIPSILSFFPLLSTIFLLFSSNSILNIILMSSAADVPVGFGQWSLFYSLALAAPSTSYLSHVVSSGWMLLSGCIAIMCGLLATSLCPLPSQQLMVFTVTTGIGTALMFHGAYIGLSKRFARQLSTSCIAMLLVFTAVIINAERAVANMEVLSDAGTLVTVVLLLTCAIPAGIMIIDSSTSSDAQEQPTDDVDLSAKQLKTPAKMASSHRLFRERNSDCAMMIGWILSFVWWAIGINMTWINAKNSSSLELRMGSIQCTLSLLCFCTHFFTARVSRGQDEQYDKHAVADNHFLPLGLIGSIGLLTVMCPACINTFHNQLLFSVAYVVQVIDFSSSLSTISYLLPAKSVTVLLPTKASLPENGAASQGMGTFISCHAVMIFCVAVIFHVLINPLAYAIILLIISVKLTVEIEMMLLVVLSCTAIAVSVMRPGRRERHTLIQSVIYTI